MSDQDLDDLRSELDEFAQPGKKGGRPPLEERIIAGFEEIQRFVDQSGREPTLGEEIDIFERLYAVRLDRLRALDEFRSLLLPFDRQGLLARGRNGLSAPPENMNDDELIAELEGEVESSDITDLRHVRPTADKRAAEEIAKRTVCEDFEKFKPLFERAKEELAAGTRETRRFKTMAEIKKGQFFIVGGQMVYVADVGEEFVTDYKRRDCRLRAVYDNGTESEVLLRSLQRALHRDDTGRYLTDSTVGPVFSDEVTEEDESSGSIYVLRSMSDHPMIAAHRAVLHKIGVTGGEVTRRIANAKKDPTFLMADVEIVATYRLFNINRNKLEKIIQRVFASVRMEIEIMDRFGKPVVPEEWFLTPAFVVDEVVDRIKDGTITQYVYEPKTVRLVRINER